MNTMGGQYRGRMLGMPLLADALAAGVVVLDGGLSTACPGLCGVDT
jgi:hypothetical protein